MDSKSPTVGEEQITNANPRGRPPGIAIGPTKCGLCGAVGVNRRTCTGDADTHVKLAGPYTPKLFTGNQPSYQTEDGKQPAPEHDDDVTGECTCGGEQTVWSEGKHGSLWKCVDCKKNQWVENEPTTQIIPKSAQETRDQNDVEIVVPRNGHEAFRAISDVTEDLLQGEIVYTSPDTETFHVVTFRAVTRYPLGVEATLIEALGREALWVDTDFKELNL